ncbi:hypothetical protein [Halobacteriovorax sp. JY17]|uniref:hypothetical protein n=1 Tax=Halobacteriovorax sp. JY17 TaxID=2014617 RepID=UPI000C452CAF|nr:hypothetical protein [Halobacteriovorax sp. JY17]PIK13822.1 MAG: hypothetical protein CES88_12605 [Halobacteriovorax sp. JY17]
MRKTYLTIILVLISSNILAKSESLPVHSYIDTEFEAMFELKVFEYPKIILDCQSFFHQLVVYKDISAGDEVKRSFHLDFEQCYAAHEFLYQSQDERRPVCLTLDFDEGAIAFSNAPIEECK